MVVFFPSFSFLQSFVRYLHVHHQFQPLNAKKPLFVESRDTNVFPKYAEQIAGGEDGILFAVIGGKLSEGINFSDALGRCVVVVGMPYPNKMDVVLQEKMRYLEDQKPGLGKEYYQNLCVKAVNQAIGRAFRHQKDWAAVVFMDIRYTQQPTQSQLTSWITKQGKVCATNAAIQQTLTQFFSQFFCVF